MNLIPVIKIFKEVIIYEASQDFNYCLYGKVTKLLTGAAYKLIDRKAFLLGEDGYKYNRNSTIEVITTKPINCSCVHFCDKAVCKHILAGCLLDNVVFPGSDKMVYFYFYIYACNIF